MINRHVCPKLAPFPQPQMSDGDRSYQVRKGLALTIPLSSALLVVSWFLPREARSEASTTTSLTSAAGHADVIIRAGCSTLTVVFTLLLMWNLSWWVVASALQPLCSRDRLHPAGKDPHSSVVPPSPLKNAAGWRC